MTTIETTEAQTLTFEVREVDTDKREFVGLAVPWGEVIETRGYKEKFEKGAFGDSLSGPVFYGHDHRTGGMPIGKIAEARSTDKGMEVRVAISKTPKGDEAYTLLKDGVVSLLSVGFNPIESRMEDDVLVRTAAEFREVSVVPFSAYPSAKVAEVRSDDNTKQKESAVTVIDEPVIDPQDVADLREAYDDLERRFTVLSDTHTNGGQVSQFRSGGEFLKALASGDERAAEEMRNLDFDPMEVRDFGTMADADVTRPAWINRPLKFLVEKRRLISLFSRGPLPATGNSVEFPFVKTATGTVGEQANEGDALPYMEVALDTGTSPVRTYGGYSSLSRQAIERSDLAYLDAVLRFQALQYAKATETAARTRLLAVSGTGTGTLAANTAKGWIDAVVDAAADIEADSLGLEAEWMCVSLDVFKAIVSLMDSTGRPIFEIKGDGSNTIGAANLVRPTFDIGGMRGVMDPSLPAETAVVASSDAITVLESPGAPWRLQDESIINLTKDFSLYGYMAETVNDKKGIVKIDVGVLTP